MAFYYEELQAPISSTIDTIVLQNAIFDEVLISDDLEFDIGQEKEYFPENWTSNVKLHAKFQNNIVAGGIAYDFRNKNSKDCGFLIKRRSTSQILWTTIGFVNGDNFVINDGVLNGFFVDRSGIPNNDYEYMIIPVLFGEEYPSTVTQEVFRCWTDGICVSEKDITYYTMLEPKLDGIVQNRGTTIVETLNSKYPFAFKNGVTNYITGTAGGLFVPMLEDCKFVFDNETTHNIVGEYRKTFREWLCNGKPKLLKYYDGRTFLISITDTLNDDDSEHHDKNITSWNWSEIGDVESTTDLIKSGLIDY